MSILDTMGIPEAIRHYNAEAERLEEQLREAAPLPTWRVARVDIREPLKNQPYGHDTFSITCELTVQGMRFWAIQEVTLFLLARDVAPLTYILDSMRTQFASKVFGRLSGEELAVAKKLRELA